jgi:hypothetical protein
MALDHYVSQVYLKNFYSPALDGLMYALRKSDLKRFPTKSQDVCRIEEGSTNAYLTKDRAIEEFLKEVEPRYNAHKVAREQDGSGGNCEPCGIFRLHRGLLAYGDASAFRSAQGAA